MKTAFWMSVLVACCFVLLPVLAAQEPGLVRGTVMDPSGIPVAEAAVKLVSETTAETLKTVTDGIGQFVFAQVPPGKYLLHVKMQGFEKAELELEVGEKPVPAQRVRLELAGVQEEITVSARATSDPLSGDQNTTSVLLEHDLLKDLPTKKEDPLVVANLFVNPAANDVEGTKIVVDGVEGASLDVGPNMIKSIAVDKNPYSAEFSRPGKGRIEVTTRPGSLRRFHKRFEFNIRDASLDARNHFATVTRSRRREWIDGQIDGPLFGGKATFFLSADALRDNANEFVNATLPGGISLFDAVPVPRRTGHVFGRTDIRLSPNNLLSVRYSGLITRWANQGVGGFDLAERGFATNKRMQEVRVAHIATPTPSLLNQFVVDLRKRPDLDYSLADAPAILVNGAFNKGGAQISQRDLEKDMEFQDFVSYIHGKHSLRFGGWGKSRFIDFTDRSNFGGTFEFSDPQSYVKGLPSKYTVSQGDPRVKYNQNEIAYFFQDEIHLLPRLSLLLGVRHELQSDLDYHKNVAPRIGLTTSFANSRLIVRAGSGIFYQRLPRSLAIQTLLSDGTHLQNFVVSDPVGFPAPPAILPNSPQSVLRIDPRIRAPYAIQASLGVEGRLGSQTSLTAEYVMLRGVRLFRLRDLNAPLPATVQRPDPTFVYVGQFETTGHSDHHGVTVGVNTTFRRLQLVSRYTFSRSLDDTSPLKLEPGVIGPFPADNFNLQGERGRSDFDQRHRLAVAAILKLPQGMKLGVISTVRSGIPYNITTGYDDNNDTVFNDRPSLGNANAPFDSFGVDGQILRRDGFPACGTPAVSSCVIPGVLYNGAQVASGTLNPVNPNDVRWLVLPGPGNVGRNAGIGPGWANVDVRFTKKFTLRKAADKTETSKDIELRFDAFDLLNHTNYKTYVGTITSPHFGLPNAAFPSRELQIGLRVSF